MSHHCNVLKFIERARPDLYKVYVDSCLTHQIQNMGTKYGYTFLIPSEAEVKKISDLQAKGDDASFVKACALVNALGVKGYWKSAADAAAQKGIVGNFNGKLVPIESASGGKVQFKGGITAEINKDFKAPPTDGAGRPVQLAVWNISGLLPEGGVDAPKLPKGQKAMPKTGAFELSDTGLPDNFRFMLLTLAANEYAKHLALANRMQTKQRRENNPFVRYVLDLYHWALNERQELFYGVLLPLWSCAPAVFFVVFEPYRTSGEPIISDDIIAAWWDKGRGQCCDDYCAFLAKLDGIVASPHGMGLGSMPADCALYDAEKRKAIRKALDKCKSAARRQTGAQIVPALKAIYARLDADNCIGDCTNVYPDALHYYYKSQPYLKASQDEICYTGYVLFRELECNPFDAMRLNEICTYLGDLAYIPKGSPQDYSKNLRVLDERKFTPLTRVQILNEIATFVNSCCFVRLMLSKAEAEERGGDFIKPESDRAAFFNTEAGSMKLWGMVGQRDQHSQRALSNMMDKLSPAARQEVQALLNQGA